MRLDLKLLSMRFSQKKEEPPVSSEGVDPYLLEKVLRPVMDGRTVFLRDIDFDAFCTEDIEPLEEYHDALIRERLRLEKFTGAVQNTPPVPSAVRMFC